VQGQGDGRAGLVWAIVLVGLVGVLALTSWNRVTAPFGNSDEGLNTSVWAMCTRALRDDPLGSALGGRRPDGVEYANHPPLSCIAGAGIEAVVGEHPWATRAPAWLGTLALVPLTWLLVRRLTDDGWTATAATVAAVGTPMVATYGPMLDTPVVGLPVGAAVLAVWVREWPAEPATRLPSVPVAVALAALGGLASWQVGLLALLAAGALFVRGPDRRRALPWAAGAATGLGLSFGWAWWVYGSLGDLKDKLSYRSGGNISLVDSLDFQADWVRTLLGLSVIGVVGCVAALWDERRRPAAAVLLATTALWGTVFYGGAGGHQYWNYFTVLPAALGWGHLVDLARRRAVAAGPRRPAARRSGPIALAAACAIALWQLSGAGLAERLIDEGAPAGQALDALERPADGRSPADRTFAVVGDAVRTYAIVVYYAEAVAEQVRTPDDLARLAADDPEAPVLVVRPCLPQADVEAQVLCRALPAATSNRSEVATAGALVDDLGG
jgi:hypothetical protein